ncbi:MAG: 4Fe-4S ferredoxin, partial [Deltaproteobacteria bacterium]|nr:4Fe-4S ferredoxin [Deltaproteobacteria bacterium]
MDNTRRRFLKIAGLTVLGLGTKPVADAIAQSEKEKYLYSPEVKSGKRWAMVVDYKKCVTAGEQCVECVKACHEVHNVPDFGNPKDEVKWIWKEPFEHAFPTDANHYIEEYVKVTAKGQKFMVLCNHCENSG